MTEEQYKVANLVLMNGIKCIENIWNFEIYIAKVEGLNNHIRILRYKELFLIENLIIKNNLKNLLWNFSQ